MKRIAILLFAALPLLGFTSRNDDSCDIAVLPAATLLLPYFEVDLDDPNGETTLFTITNVTHEEQIAHVTLWNDRGVAVADFAMLLTGYDVQGINLRDVIARGLVAASCDGAPQNVDRERLRTAFTPDTERAVGYATIDVVRRCDAPHAQEPGFVDALSTQNALTGDYQQVDLHGKRAEGGPLVHIRAIPEDGRVTPFERTFYSAYQHGRDRTRDARQPLPSSFSVPAANGFAMKLKVWRERENGTERVVELIDANEHGPRQLDFGTQAWVIASQRGNGMAVDVDATPLTNGCALMTPPRTNDSCEIALLPAATLLLPYFEVDTVHRDRTQTPFSVTNTSALPHVAHVTLWTDYGYPVLTFDLVLAGYESRSIDLFEVLANGRIPADCGARTELLPDELRRRAVSAFTLGRLPDSALRCNNIGSSGHFSNRAVGYATIDVVNTCTPLDATQPEYWDRIAYDNVLTGDYRRSNIAGSQATASPLVHIRAIPNARMERTFYGRFQSASAPRRDARQPLPSVFAAHWIGNETAQQMTDVTIWQDGRTAANAACVEYGSNVQLMTEVVKFDENENAVKGNWPCTAQVCPLNDYSIAMAGRYDVQTDESLFPLIAADAGWAYINVGRQGWVTTTMQSHGIFSVAADAVALGNGCSPLAPRSTISDGTHVIGPSNP